MIFEYLLNNKLIFNTSWEDPQIDLSLLKIDENSVILNIGSAGDNSLEYLLENPKKLYVCEINKAQIALIELKRIIFTYFDYNVLSRFFMTGTNLAYKEDYIKIKPYLSESSQVYWDKNIHYFAGNRRSFYYHGASGIIAFYIQKLLKRNKQLKLEIENILNNKSTDFDFIEKTIWNHSIIKFLSLPYVHNLFGVPSSQMKLSSVTEISENIRVSLKNHFELYPNTSNYFWYLYFFGKYNEQFCPNYLKEENFNRIKSNIHKMSLIDIPLLQALDLDEFNIINLLDHQDWHLINNQEYLTTLWNKINSMQNKRKLMFRTVSSDRNIFDKYFNHQYKLNSYSNKDLKYINRVATYFYAHIAESIE